MSANDEGTKFSAEKLAGDWASAIGASAEADKGVVAVTKTAGRTPGAGVPVAAAPTFQIDEKELAAIFEILGDVFTDLAGVTNLTPEQVEKLGKAGKPLAEKWGKDLFANWAPEIGFGLAVLVVGAPKIKEYAEIKAKEAEAEKEIGPEIETATRTEEDF